MRLLTFGFLGLVALVSAGYATADQDTRDSGIVPAPPPKEARRAFEKAAAAAKARRAAEAIHGYEQAVTLFPGYAEAWCELGKLRLEEKQLDTARDAFEAAIRADPKYVDAYMPLATLENAAGHWKQLVADTDGLLRLNAIDFPQAWLLNAVGHYNGHDLEAAEKSAREAARLDPNQKFPETLRVLGLILAQRGDFAGEAEQFRKYLSAAPSGPEAEAVRAKLTEAEKRAGNTAPESGPTFRTETSLAVVRFQVRPKKGEPIRNLLSGDIEVREDGVAQKIALFEGGRANPRTVPVEISLLFDCSASVDRIAALNARVFRENLLDEFPNASIAIYGFSDNLVRFTKPTRNADALKRALDRVASIPQRDTPLFGSIADTVRDAAATGVNVVRMVVIFSDGVSEWPGDGGRSGEAARVAEESGAALFPVILDKSAAANSTDSAGSIHDFMNLASATGGRGFQGFMGTDVLPIILKAVASEIRCDYVAGFYLPASGQRKSHKIEVVLRSKDSGQLYGGSRLLVH